MDESNKILEDNYKAWVKSPSGVDLLAYLDQEFQADLDRALDETDPVKAVGLLQKANAYRTIRAYIQRMDS